MRLETLRLAHRTFMLVNGDNIVKIFLKLLVKVLYIGGMGVGHTFHLSIIRNYQILLVYS